MDDEKNNVIPISEGIYDVPGVQDSVIDLLEELLELAEKGEIIGIVIGAVRANGEIGTFSRKGSARYSVLLSAATMTQFDLCYHWAEDE